MTSPLLRLLCFAVVLCTPSLLLAQRERLTPEEIELVEKSWPGTKKTSTGIRYVIVKPGDGASPKSGDRVGVTYVGTLLNGGKKFDEMLDANRPLTFRVGRSEVIDGWDQILPLMKLNEKRIVIIPGALAYGSRGRAPNIPRDAALVFEMQLVSINPP